MKQKIKRLSDEMLRKKQKEYLEKLRTLDNKSSEYAEAYKKWIYLRIVGEKRNLWGFIPLPDE